MKKFLGNTVYALLGFVLACAVFLSSSLVFASSASPVGDVNGDGAVTPLDLIVLTRYLAKWKGYEELPYTGPKTDFIITETRNQHFYMENGGVEAPIDYDADTEYVGLQHLENGIPTGQVFYFPCEELGIPDENAEEYINYLVTLTSFNEDDCSFNKAIIGNAPKTITNADIGYKSDNTKLVIDGISYTAVEAYTGTALLNEIIIYECAPRSAVMKMVLLTNEDGDIIDYSGNVVAVFAYESSTGAKYYYDQTSGNNKVITAAKALEMFGVYASDTTDEYTHTQIVSNPDSRYTVANSMYQKAYEISLFDDDNDGKYERAFYEKVYLSVYDTYEAETDDGTVVTCDAILENVYGLSGMEADSVDYTDKSVKTVGAVSVFTYNEQLNTVNVIDVIKPQTGCVEEVSVIDESSGIIEITVDGEIYRLGNADAATPDTDIMAALLVPYNESADNPPVEDVSTVPFIQYIDDTTVFAEELTTDDFIGFYAYNGIIIYASVLEQGYTVVEDFADFDLAEIYLDLWIGGELQEETTITELDGKELADLSSYKFSMLLAEKEYYYPGTIYQFKNEWGQYTLSGIIDKSNYTEHGLIDAKVADETYAGNLAEYEEAIAADPEQTAVVAPTTGKIVFDAGYTDGSDRTTRIRTSSDTVFYFIENAECDCETPCDPTSPAEDCDSLKPAMRTVSAFTGQPENAAVYFDENTDIWVDALGYGTEETNGRASVVFVINPVEHSGFFRENPTYVVTNASAKATKIASAEKLELPEEYTGTYYMYNNVAASLDDALRMTLYSKVELSCNHVYKVDANGVVYLEDSANFGEGAILTDTENHQHWLSAGVVSSMNSNRNYVKYGITDVNGQANTAADASWEVPNGTVRYYDYVWYSKANSKEIVEAQAEFAELLAEVANKAIAGEISTNDEYAVALGYVDENGVVADAAAAGVVKAFLADLVDAGVEVTADDIEFEEIPDSITGIDLVTPLVHAEFIGDYVEVEILAGYNAGTYLIDEDDHISDIIVVKQNGLGAVTGEEAIELLNSAPQVMWIGEKDHYAVYGELFSEYLIDGSILFVVGYANNDK